ncbi:MAG: hypothetical protein JWO83_4668 [Caulobacteraceae bacterium]|nr:hypothetical protein [Caulobacteraceae bacterium]
MQKTPESGRLTSTGWSAKVRLSDEPAFDPAIRHHTDPFIYLLKKR